MRESGFAFNVNLCSTPRKGLDDNAKKSVLDAQLFFCGLAQGSGCPKNGSFPQDGQYPAMSLLTSSVS
jgi:hypothetical protein